MSNDAVQQISKIGREKQMKLFKRLMAVMFALTLTLGMGTRVFAEDTGTKTITINNGKAGHTYTLYQVFTGKVDGEELTNIQWGDDAPAKLKTDYATAAAAAKAIADQQDARAWAKSQTFTGGTAKVVAKDGEVKFENLKEGYYVVIDTNGNTDPVEGDFSSAIIVQVVKDVKMDLKGNIPSSEKKVDDKNDSNTNEDAVEWEDSADYDIGDDVPFQLKATTADNVDAYKKYHVTFQDEYSNGLDAPSSYTITVPGTNETISLQASATEAVTKEVTFGTAENAVTVIVTVENTPATATRGFAIKVSFANKDNKKLLPVDLNSKDILVHYSSKLNSNAVIGSEGNPNKMFITYSSNPESTDDSEEGKTPVDKVIVFTYKPVINKTDENGRPLEGAGFTLYKEVAASYAPNQGETVKTGEVIKRELSTQDASINADALNDSSNYVAKAMTIVNGSETSFEYKGIDDGTYVIVETTIPTGYNAFVAKEFVVSATHDAESPDPKLTELKGGDLVTGDFKDTGIITTDIENKSGSTLPSTGGIGTTIFYVLGGLLVAGAGIVLVARKKAAE